MKIGAINEVSLDISIKVMYIDLQNGLLTKHPKHTKNSVKNELIKPEPKNIETEKFINSKTFFIRLLSYLMYPYYYERIV